MTIELEFDREIQTFGSIPQNDEVVKKVKETIEALKQGPASGGGYLGWSGNELQAAEFELARYAEYLGEQEAKKDALHTFADDKFRQIFDRTKQEVRVEFSNTKVKYTNTEIEEESRRRCGPAEDKLNKLYYDYKLLRSLVESVQRFLLVLTHRINELISEKKYRQ